jgi:hypothetical protein
MPPRSLTKLEIYDWTPAGYQEKLPTLPCLIRPCSLLLICLLNGSMERSDSLGNLSHLKYLLLASEQVCKAGGQAGRSRGLCKFTLCTNA